MDTCFACGSKNLVRNIPVGKTAETGCVGLEYKAVAIVTGTEGLLADLCSDCGTVVRLHVKDTDHKWHTRK